MSKFLIASLLTLWLVLCTLEADERVNIHAFGPSPPQKIDCGKECSRRCRLSSRPRLCDRACGTCCNRCNCVPPGTAGNQEICPCYANMTTHGGRKKCP
ncbi:gibberellin-regulated protein 1-like [Olea europaea var. sylvestris]|uniref:Snakin-2 n=1 Tax=Olea europaea subsp. europaea TaxID=158383 RepID=A0A8S0TAQ5_OLEEU|nr:gibberellin-regulated protein 1-like [Olea europaea var. sylvestris]CAA3002194.1 Hypothetical predicted protein [Olea europaea subsp. europaea]